MRPVHIADLDACVRHLLALPACVRAAAATQIVARADTADRFRKRLCRAHDRFGTGTLAAAVPSDVDAAQPLHCDGTYLAALSLVIAALNARRAG